MKYLDYLNTEIYPEVEERVQEAMLSGDNWSRLCHTSDTEAVFFIWKEQDFPSLVEQICKAIETGVINDIAPDSWTDKLWNRVHEISCENPIFDEIHEKNPEAARKLMWEVIALDEKAATICGELVAAAQEDVQYLIVRALAWYR